MHGLACIAVLLLATPPVEVANGDDAAAALTAIDTLSLTKDPEAFRALALLVAHPEPARKRRAQEGLARMPIEETTLIDLLDKDDNLIVKKAAAWSLGVLSSEPAVPVLLDQLKSTDDELRAQSATALGRIGDERALVPLLKIANKDDSPDARQAATRALEELSDPSGTRRLPPLAPLLDALVAPDPLTRQQTAVTLAQRGNRRCVGPLLDQAAIEQDPEARRAMYEALGEIGDPIATPFLVDALDTKNTNERYSVMAALAVLRDMQAVEPLTRIATDDTDATARRLAVRALSYMSTSDSQQAIAAALVDRSPPVRIEAIRSLETLKARSEIATIEKRLKDPEPTVRAEAARLLGVWEVTASSAKLVKLLVDDDSRVVRQAAVVALGRAGDRDALDAMAKFVANEGKKKVADRDAYLMEQTNFAIIELTKRLPEVP